jgi:hypothetical protein
VAVVKLRRYTPYQPRSGRIHFASVLDTLWKTSLGGFGRPEQNETPADPTGAQPPVENVAQHVTTIALAWTVLKCRGWLLPPPFKRKLEDYADETDGRRLDFRWVRVPEPGTRHLSTRPHTGARPLPQDPSHFTHVAILFPAASPPPPPHLHLVTSIIVLVLAARPSHAVCLAGRR